jgi:aldehyde dehydrogenase (NAD+)
MINKTELYIDGAWTPSSGTTAIEVISPASEEIYARVPDGTDDDFDAAITAARVAFDHGPWRWMAPAERAAVLEKAAARLDARMPELASQISSEMGCPIALAPGLQVWFPVALLRYYASLARRYQWEERRQDSTGSSLVLHEPVGVVLAIIPWNFPLAIAMQKVAPALAAGCSVVLKPAPEAPLSGYAMAEAFEQAGLPPGVFNMVPSGRESGEYAVRHPGIDKVSFTGSTAAGRRVGAICGEQIKRCSLELGGKSAAIVLDDADPEEVAASLMSYGLRNSGQVCSALSRILVPERRRKELADAIVTAVEGLTVGDPASPLTVVGPVVTSRQRDRVENYIETGRRQGAALLTGGGRPKGLDRGWYVEPTVFGAVTPDMAIAREEIFGPVLSVLSYWTEDEAVRIANDSDYGLFGGVWTGDPERGLSVARRVRSGTYTVNGSTQCISAPFGGRKLSGLGRELGPEGLAEFVELKSVAVPTDFRRASDLGQVPG